MFIKTWKVILLLLIIWYPGVYGQKVNIPSSNDTQIHKTIYRKERKLFYVVKQYNKEGRLIKTGTLVFSTSPQMLHAQYGQTRSTWKRKGEIMTEITGITENDTVLWIHPPRFEEYCILELSPFPMIHYPIEIASRWQWDLRVGGEWGRKEWIEWQGTKLFRSYYKIIEKRTLTTRFGNLESYKVQCEGKNDFAQTELVFYFNESYGFVKMNYKNIDQTFMHFELVGESLLNLQLDSNRFIIEENNN